MRSQWRKVALLHTSETVLLKTGQCCSVDYKRGRGLLTESDFPPIQWLGIYQCGGFLIQSYTE